MRPVITQLAVVPATELTAAPSTVQLRVFRPFAIAVAIQPVAAVESAGSDQLTRMVPRPAVSVALTGALGA